MAVEVACCAGCGAGLPASSGRGRPRRFCTSCVPPGTGASASASWRAVNPERVESYNASRRVDRACAVCAEPTPSGRHPYCERCRPLVIARERTSGVGWRGFVPQDRRCAVCARSFVARAPHGRFCSKSCRERSRTRLSASERGYGPEHSRLRRQVAAVVKAGAAVCWRCGLPIAAGQAWDLGHDDDDRSVYRGPEHRHARDCPQGGNRATSGRRRRTSRRW